MRTGSRAWAAGRTWAPLANSAVPTALQRPLLPPAPCLPATAPPSLRLIVFSNPSCPHGSDMGFWCSHNSASPSPAKASTLSPPTARPTTSPPAMPARAAADGETDSHPFVTFSSQPRSGQASSRQKYRMLVKLLGNNDHSQPPSLLAHKTIIPSNGLIGTEGAQARTEACLCSRQVG